MISQRDIFQHIILVARIRQNETERQKKNLLAPDSITYHIEPFHSGIATILHDSVPEKGGA